ncbi:SocA family protein, partial [Candidatus Parcubacteria bacterium]|nr:SocA family protein [Candidatus Parcubacteria bacterium]
YEKYEEQLIGATYIKNRYGPTPIEFKKIIDQMQIDKEVTKINNKYFQYEQKKYLPRREPDLSKLSAQEITHIDGVLDRLSNKSAKELSEYSHNDIPWKTHDNGEKINYESVFYRDDKYSVREYEDEL